MFYYSTTLTLLNYFHPLHKHLCISWGLLQGVHLCTSAQRANNRTQTSSQKPLVSKRKLLSTELRNLKRSGYTVFAL